MNLEKSKNMKENIERAMIDREKFRRDLDWCTEFYKKHQEGIPQGKYVMVVYPEEEVKIFHTYDEAINEVNKLPDNVAALVTEHPMEEMILGARGLFL